MTNMIDIAKSLRDDFDGRAAEHDRDGSFPHENYEELREAGYLRGPVPQELGGLGADLIETARAQRALGYGDASTALAVNMHLFQVGAAAEGWYGSGANEPPLRKIAEEGMVMGSTGAEAIVAGEWSTPTKAVLDGDEYVITGRKYFASQAPATQMLRVNAEDSETGEILVVGVPMSAPGVEIVETWDTLGMRATGSHDIVLEDVRVPATAVAARLPASAPAWDPKFANAIKWFLPLMTGVYVGIADRAREEALAALGSGRNSSFRDDALTEALIGQLQTAHFRAEAAHEFGIAGVADADNPVDAMVAAITLKDAAIAAAVETVALANQLVGGKSFFKKSVLERLTRDVQASAYHPPSAPVSSQMIGRRALSLREASAAVEAAEAVTAS
jgi:alkylation response protein AidB-like acyl-CoA dehydrogenase